MSISARNATRLPGPEMPSTIPANRYMQVDARIDGPYGNPLNPSVKPEITLKMPAGVSEKEIRQPILMYPRPGARDGWFSARFQVRSPGEYAMTLKVPRHAGQDTDLSETRKFLVTEANPGARLAFSCALSPPRTQPSVQEKTIR